MTDGTGAGAGPSLAKLQQRLRDRFRAAALDSPELDARLICGHVLGLDLTGLVLAADRPVEAQAVAAIAALAARRLAGEPVARLVGTKEFYGLSFRLGPEALVPRPDSETLVERALALIDAEGGRGRRLSIADLGIGSGALLAALLDGLPAAVGVGVDIAPGAAAVAAGNLQALGLAARSLVVVGSFAAALAPGAFDLVVSNPPYIPSGAIDGLMPEVARHDPRRALDGGADGLDAYRALAGPAAGALREGGRLLVEIGFDQAAAVGAILAAAGYRRIATTRDLGGNDRVVEATRP